MKPNTSDTWRRLMTVALLLFNLRPSFGSAADPPRPTPRPGTLGAYAKKITLNRSAWATDDGRVVLTNDNVVALAADGSITLGTVAHGPATGRRKSTGVADNAERARWQAAHHKQRQVIAALERRRSQLELEIDQIENLGPHRKDNGPPRAAGGEAAPARPRYCRRTGAAGADRPRCTSPRRRARVVSLVGTDLKLSGREGLSTAFDPPEPRRAEGRRVTTVTYSITVSPPATPSPLGSRGGPETNLAVESKAGRGIDDRVLDGELECPESEHALDTRLAVQVAAS